jgi:glutathione S-transferase
MDNIFADPVIRAYAISVVLTIVLLYGLGSYTAAIRAARKLVLNAEDVGVNAGASVGTEEHVDVARIKRAHMNLIENAVPFFAIGLLYLVTEPGKNFARVLFATFVLARIAHAVFYLRAMQPFRTLAFAVGALVNLTMAIQVVRAIIKA